MDSNGGLDQNLYDKGGSSGPQLACKFEAILFTVVNNGRHFAMLALGKMIH